MNVEQQAEKSNKILGAIMTTTNNGQGTVKQMLTVLTSYKPEIKRWLLTPGIVSCNT